MKLKNTLKIVRVRALFIAKTYLSNFCNSRPRNILHGYKYRLTDRSKSLAAKYFEPDGKRRYVPSASDCACLVVQWRMRLRAHVFCVRINYSSSSAFLLPSPSLSVQRAPTIMTMAELSSLLPAKTFSATEHCHLSASLLIVYQREGTNIKLFPSRKHFAS